MTPKPPRRSAPGSAKAGEPADPAPITFEAALDTLEGIVERIERGEIGLERSIAEYEQGMALIKRCRDILEKAEQRVDELNRGAISPDRASPVADADELDASEADDEPDEPSDDEEP